MQLYAYAKVAEGKDFSAAKKPGMFDLAVCFIHLFFYARVFGEGLDIRLWGRGRMRFVGMEG